MQSLMLTSTVIDVLAVAALAWLVLRSGRQQDAALGVQRAALESLRADLAELVEDAERRTQSLASTLDAREERLRALLADLDRADGRRSGGTKRETAAAAKRPPRAPAVPAAGAEDVRDLANRLGVDPAEARLLRDLQVRVEPRRA